MPPLNIKKEIIKYLFTNSTLRLVTIREMCEPLDHSWKTIKDHLDILIENNLVIKQPILRKKYEIFKGAKTGRYRFVKTGRSGYVLNFDLAKKRGLIQ